MIQKLKQEPHRASYSKSKSLPPRQCPYLCHKFYATLWHPKKMICWYANNVVNTQHMWITNVSDDTVNTGMFCGIPHLYTCVHLIFVLEYRFMLLSIDRYNLSVYVNRCVKSMSIHTNDMQVYKWNGMLKSLYTLNLLHTSGFSALSPK